MSEEMNLGVEVQEPAEPAVETHVGVEVQEPAEPAVEVTEGKTEQDAAFAEMRRQLAEMEKRATDAETELSQQRALLGRASDAENPALELVAQSLGIDPDELKQAYEEELEGERLEKEREDLKKEVADLQFEKFKREDLEAVQKIDPSIKNFEELDETFLQCRTAGMSAEQAYYAMKSIQEKTKVTAPEEIGKVNQSNVEKDFFTKAEVEAMSPAEVEKNLEVIEKSMPKW